MKEIVLKNKEAFKKVLSSYEVSDHARDTLRELDYVVLVGIAAGGRNTIINELQKSYKYKFIVSDTTRPPKFRDGKMEQEGVNYYFRREEDFLDDLTHGMFLEAELIHDQQVSGTSIRELQRVKKENMTAISEVEFGGAQNIASVKPDTKVIAIFPPSYEVWQSRLRKRDAMSGQELKNRLETALKVIDLVERDENIYIVINDEFHHAAERVDRINKQQLSVSTTRERSQEIIDSFRNQITEHLTSI